MLFDFYPQLALVRETFKGRRVFVVGGAVRDYYLKRRGPDLDFAVDKGAIALARRLARRIKGAFVLLDEEHGCARVVKKIDGAAFTFDLTDWRGGSIQKDLALRDFTINALAADVGARDDSAVLEFKGARRDLKNKVIRMVSRRAFKDDPLRLLRAYTLQAVLGFKIEPRTAAQIKKDAHLITDAASERIREEIFKILASPRAAATVAAMDRVGLLPQLLPQISVMYGVKQGGYHHLDVWEHSLEVLAHLEKLVEDKGQHERLRAYLDETLGGGHSRLSLLKMAALLHDVGKPETRRKEGTRVTFHGHEHAGARITRLAAKQLKLSVRERYFLEDAVRMHLRPGYLANFKRPSDRAVFRYLRDTRGEGASLALLGLADQAATRGPLTTEAKAGHHAKVCRMLIEKFFEVKEEKPQERLLSGHDLIRVLKLRPSPLFARILTGIEEAAALGKIKTRAEALQLARQLAGE